jgi:outer membrane protein assembly factor BamB
MMTNIAVGDVIGDDNKEILVTDNKGYLYVFDMPDISSRVDQSWNSRVGQSAAEIHRRDFIHAGDCSHK